MRVIIIGKLIKSMLILIRPAFRVDKRVREGQPLYRPLDVAREPLTTDSTDF